MAILDQLDQLLPQEENAPQACFVRAFAFSTLRETAAPLALCRRCPLLCVLHGHLEDSTRGI